MIHRRWFKYPFTNGDNSLVSWFAREAKVLYLHTVKICSDKYLFSATKKGNWQLFRWHEKAKGDELA